MKHACGAIIALLLISGSASTPTVHVPGFPAVTRAESQFVPHAALNRSVADVEPNTLLQEYADQVNSLFEAYQNGLRLISAAVNAGKLTPEQGQALKLDGARVVVSRLETLTAVYDSLLTDSGDEDADPADGDEVPFADGLIRIAEHVGRIRCPSIASRQAHKEIQPRLHTDWID